MQKHHRKIPELKPLFLERMKKLLKKDFETYLKILKQEPVRSIRCNTLKISPEKLKIRLEKKSWKIKQPWKDYPEVMIVEGKLVDEIMSNKKIKIETRIVNKKINSSEASEIKGGCSGVADWDEVAISSEAIRNSCSEIKGSSKETSRCLSPGELGRTLEHLLGYYYIQELASMLPVFVLKPKSEELILDLAAAPGSKTTQIASKMENKGIIIANDVNIGRIKILASNLERCGCSNTIITQKDGIILCKKLKEKNYQFDRILVDAPCSGEGTLRSSVKTYLMWNIKTIKNLPKIQKALISHALEILKPKGTLIYSTCTHAPEENEEVIDYILNKFDNIKLEEIKLPIKSRLGITSWEDKTYNPEVKKCARVYPQDNNTEGFFIAKLKKT